MSRTADSGSSVVIAFVLLLMLFVAAITLWALIGAPAQLENAEETYLTEVENSFIEYKLATDTVRVNDNIGGRLSMLIPGRSGFSGGYLQFAPDTGGMVTITTKNVSESVETKARLPISRLSEFISRMSGTTEIGYENGGIFRSDGSNATWLTPGLLQINPWMERFPSESLTEIVYVNLTGEPEIGSNRYIPVTSVLLMYNDTYLFWNESATITFESDNNPMQNSLWDSMFHEAESRWGDTIFENSNGRTDVTVKMEPSVKLNLTSQSSNPENYSVIVLREAVYNVSIAPDGVMPVPTTRPVTPVPTTGTPTPTQTGGGGGGETPITTKYLEVKFNTYSNNTPINNIVGVIPGRGVTVTILRVLNESVNNVMNFSVDQPSGLDRPLRVPGTNINYVRNPVIGTEYYFYASPGRYTDSPYWERWENPAVPNLNISGNFTVQFVSGNTEDRVERGAANLPARQVIFDYPEIVSGTVQQYMGGSYSRMNVTITNQTLIPPAGTSSENGIKLEVYVLPAGTVDNASNASGRRVYSAPIPPTGTETTIIIPEDSKYLNQYPADSKVEILVKNEKPGKADWSAWYHVASLKVSDFHPSLNIILNTTVSETGMPEFIPAYNLSLVKEVQYIGDCTLESLTVTPVRIEDTNEYTLVGSDAVILDLNGTDVTSEYTLTYTNGTLTVKTPIAISLSPTGVQTGTTTTYILTPSGGMGTNTTSWEWLDLPDSGSQSGTGNVFSAGFNSGGPKRLKATVLDQFGNTNSTEFIVTVSTTQYKITAETLNSGGTVTPTSQFVYDGDNAEIMITADSNKVIENVYLDETRDTILNGASYGIYVVKNVRANHAVTVLFGDKSISGDISDYVTDITLGGVNIEAEGSVHVDGATQLEFDVTSIWGDWATQYRVTTLIEILDDNGQIKNTETDTYTYSEGTVTAHKITTPYLQPGDTCRITMNLEGRLVILVPLSNWWQLRENTWVIPIT